MTRRLRREVSLVRFRSRNNEVGAPRRHRPHDCVSAPKWGSSALLVQSDGTRGDQGPYGRDIYGGLISRIVPLSAAADPGRSVGRAGPAHARPRHHRYRAHAVPERVSALRRPLRAGPQPLHPQLGRPALAGTCRRRPGAGTAVPLRHGRLPAPDLHRTPIRGRTIADQHADTVAQLGKREALQRCGIRQRHPERESRPRPQRNLGWVRDTCLCRARHNSISRTYPNLVARQFAPVTSELT